MRGIRKKPQIGISILGIQKLWCPSELHHRTGAEKKWVPLVPRRLVISLVIKSISVEFAPNCWYILIDSSTCNF